MDLSLAEISLWVLIEYAFLKLHFWKLSTRIIINDRVSFQLMSIFRTKMFIIKSLPLFYPLIILL